MAPDRMFISAWGFLVHFNPVTREEKRGIVRFACDILFISFHAPRGTQALESLLGKWQEINVAKCRISPPINPSYVGIGSSVTLASPLAGG